jgi:hypothetical protein
MPARAEGAVTIDPDAVLDLAAEPWRDRSGFRARLATVLGDLQVDMPRLPDALLQDDPFLWSLTGRFGAPVEGTSAPGGIFACSRYGLSTRDIMAESNLTDPRTFALFGATQAAHDDAEAWPEAGLARLACMITWDDTRRVEIIPEAPAVAAVAARFDEVSLTGDAERYGENWQDYAPIYGEQGYRLEGRGGARTSLLVLDRALIELTVGHQKIRFRAFLLNGGV